ncbi:MAG: periplasmic polysaccharide biosynthesis/export protein [Desulfobacteraceae bacterium]|nr:SLBB domain-containing protein [Desulfobacteraceae bacterium]MBC2758181.1 periplasmic polysaccharide biosynthesis/export protein [Desulfobacteraceae bacterium]
MKKALYLTFIINFLVNFTPILFAQDYVLGEGDVLTISVYDHPDLRTTVRISGDGMITLPLIGQLSAAGESIEKIGEKIESLLADGYIINPNVNIFIEEFRNRKATILGGVNNPGLYELKGHTTLLELISKAGGLKEKAASEAIIQRDQPDSKQKKIIIVNLFQLMEQGQESLNLSIVNGDNIYIPKKKVFYVTGEVNRPDVYDYEEGLTVIQALTKAGGVNDKAAPTRIHIIRSTDGKEHVREKVKMDLPIQPNDVIVVPESYF